MVKKGQVIDISESIPIIGQYYGIDLHKDQITWHCINRMSDGNYVRTVGVVSTERIVEDFLPHLTAEMSYLVVEASASAFFFYSLILPHCA